MNIVIIDIPRSMNLRRLSVLPRETTPGTGADRGTGLSHL
jgi:hypothetical protein